MRIRDDIFLLMLLIKALKNEKLLLLINLRRDRLIVSVGPPADTINRSLRRFVYEMSAHTTIKTSYLMLYNNASPATPFPHMSRSHDTTTHVRLCIPHTAQ